jgi:hypothetical protein
MYVYFVSGRGLISTLPPHSTAHQSYLSKAASHTAVSMACTISLMIECMPASATPMIYPPPPTPVVLAPSPVPGLVLPESRLLTPPPPTPPDPAPVSAPFWETLEEPPPVPPPLLLLLLLLLPPLAVAAIEVRTGACALVRAAVPGVISTEGAAGTISSATAPPPEAAPPAVPSAVKSPPFSEREALVPGGVVSSSVSPSCTLPSRPEAAAVEEEAGGRLRSWSCSDISSSCMPLTALAVLAAAAAGTGALLLVAEEKLTLFRLPPAGRLPMPACRPASRFASNKCSATVIVSFVMQTEMF